MQNLTTYQLSNDEIKYLISLCASDLDEIKRAFSSKPNHFLLAKNKETIDLIILKLREQLKSNPLSQNETVVYNKDAKIQNKIFTILKIERKALALNDFFEKMNKFGDNISSEATELKKLKSNLAGTLKFYFDKGELNRSRLGDENNQFYWGLSEWFDENNNLDLEFIP